MGIIRGRWGLSLAMVLAGVLLQGCATGGTGRKQVDPAGALIEAQAACKELIETRLKAPVNTEIGPKVKEIKKEIKASSVSGETGKAVELAEDLTAQCKDETRLREELAQVAYEVHIIRTEVPRNLYNRFMKLAVTGRYTEAIFCGDGLLTRRLQHCDIQGKRYSPTISNTVTIQDAERDGSASEAMLALKDREAKETAARREAQASPEVKRALAAAHQKALYKGEANAQAELPPDLPTSEEQKPVKVDKPRLWTWVALGGAGAFLITGGILAGLSQSQYDELEKSCPNCTQEEVDNGYHLAVGADVMFALGTVAAAAGAALFLFEGRWFGDDERKKEVKVGVVPGGLSLTGSF